MEPEQHLDERGARLVYVVPPETAPTDQIDIFELWQTLWRGKWLIIGMTTLASILSVAYALMAQQWFIADVTLAPAAARSTQSVAGGGNSLGALAGLAAGLVGISIGGGGTQEPLAVLKSRDFTRQFIEDENLLPVLFAEKWDPSTKTWKSTDPKLQPDLRDGIEYFDKNVRKVREDKKTGMVNMSIEWKDPAVAAEWANLLVTRLNDHMRVRALAEAETNVTYLRRELESSQIVTLQQSIGRLLEGELQKVMLARGNSEFAFKVIDRAQPPKRRSRPQRPRVVLMSVAAAVMLSSFYLFLMQAIRTRQARDSRKSNETSP